MNYPQGSTFHPAGSQSPTHYCPPGGQAWIPIPAAPQFQQPAPPAVPAFGGGFGGAPAANGGFGAPTAAFNPAGAFRGMNEAVMVGGGENFRAGQHLAEITKLEMRPSQEQPNILVFVAETSVAKSIGGRHTSALDPCAPLSEPHTIGSVVSWVQLSKWQGWLGNVKNFFEALMPSDYPGTVEQYAEWAVSPEQPLTGKLVFADASVIATKGRNTGGVPNDFTKIVWRPADQAPSFLPQQQAAAQPPAPQFQQPPAPQFQQPPAPQFQQPPAPQFQQPPTLPPAQPVGAPTLPPLLPPFNANG